MAKLNEFIKEFVPEKMHNVADLDFIDLSSADIFHDGKGINENEEEYNFSYLLVNNQKYRITKGVLTDIQELIKTNPNLTKFRVNKTGEGKKGTKYKVIPIL